mmetsp:Transcript_21750/g.38989  ORF Transcript_21750/g.38989 Transcript_21750/m.38989 type:complete len:91 (-) Transcript_21750:288-560(-)
MANLRRVPWLSQIGYLDVDWKCLTCLPHLIQDGYAASQLGTKAWTPQGVATENLSASSSNYLLLLALQVTWPPVAFEVLDHDLLAIPQQD